MAQFNSSRYEIFTHRQPSRDEQSPFAPTSPERSVSPVGTQRPQFQKLAVSYVGLEVAKKVSGTMVQEISDVTGNPRFVTAANNLQSIAGVVALAKFGGLPGLAVAAGVGLVNEVVRQKNIQRQVANLEYENKMRGARLNVGGSGGRSYFD